MGANWTGEPIPDIPERPWKWALLDYALLIAVFVILGVIGVVAS
jgi:hypothetical protein